MLFVCFLLANAINPRNVTPYISERTIFFLLRLRHFVEKANQEAVFGRLVISVQTK